MGCSFRAAKLRKHCEYHPETKRRGENQKGEKNGAVNTCRRLTPPQKKKKCAGGDGQEEAKVDDEVGDDEARLWKARRRTRPDSADQSNQTLIRRQREKTARHVLKVHTAGCWWDLEPTWVVRLGLLSEQLTDTPYRCLHQRNKAKEDPKKTKEDSCQTESSLGCSFSDPLQEVTDFWWVKYGNYH